MENVPLPHRIEWHWHDMEMSEHGFYAPKRFKTSPGLTNTKVRSWGPKPSNMSKNLNSFLN